MSMQILSSTTRGATRPKAESLVYLVSRPDGAIATGPVAQALLDELGSGLCIDSPNACRGAIPTNPVPPRCVLIDAMAHEGPEWAAWARTDARLCDVPLILLVDKPTEDAFLVARRCGADDVVGIDDAAGLVRRVRNLSAFVPGTRPNAEQGVALVAHYDDARRRHAGWVLRRGGYELAFANTYRDAVAHGREKKPALAVIANGLLSGDDVDGAVTKLREELELPDLPVVLLSSGATHLHTALPRVAMSNDGQDWDYLLFQISQVTRPLVAEMRASRRVFWATKVAFRPLMSFEPSYGLTYDVSAGGLFVRTTDTPERGSTVNIELRLSPGGDRVVTLRARVVWVHLPRAGVASRTPAGFGVELIDGECPGPDLPLYRAGCSLLADSEPAPARLMVP